MTSVWGRKVGNPAGRSHLKSPEAASLIRCSQQEVQGRMVETRSPRPVLLAVDDEAHALAKIERELSNQYGRGYRLACEASAEVGIEALERCEADGEEVTLVLNERLMELVAQLYRTVARYGGEDASRFESGLGPRGDHKSDQGPNRIGPCAPCACSRAGL